MPMKIGVVLVYGEGFESDVLWCIKNGIMTCQLHISAEHQTDANAARIRAIVDANNFEITAVISMWSGPMVWDFVDGPSTLGLVPVAYRYQRTCELIHAAQFAKKLGVRDVNTHMGFIPENPSDALYRDFIVAARFLATRFQELGICLNMETGQETPITMLRTITDIGLGNVGVNFDPANLLMYGKANPIDALSILGKYVRGVHAKDGEYPTNGLRLGEEKALGHGMVNIPALVQKLKDVGYTGALTIEREISGDEQQKDVLAANALLNSLL